MTFVSLARNVDDGEAQVLAVGLHRSIVVATDDRKAQRVGTDLGLTLTRTPELIIGWAASLTKPAVAARAIVDIEVRAHYRPRASDPLRAAWDHLRDGR